MRIERLRIENFGEIKEFKAEFGGGLNVICPEYWPDILSIMAIVSGSRILGFNSTRHIFTPNTRIYASISGNFGKAEVELFYDKNCSHACGNKITLNGSLSSFKELQGQIGASPEEEECAVYINADDFRKFVPFSEYDFSRKLNLYLNYAPQNGNSDIMSTPKFNEILRGFISSFEQIPINSSKDIWLSIKKDGTFFPLCRGKDRDDLSMSERTIFNYLCFLEVNRFWGQVAGKLNFRESFPLYICDFICFIDEAVNIKPLIDRMLSLGRQVFLFSDIKDTAERLINTDDIKVCMSGDHETYFSRYRRRS